MNNTVKRIVDLLFEGKNENEEVNALHEELLNNCQEHFEDLISRGLSEDEAISEVIASLKGMEDVIREAGEGRDPEKNGEERRTEMDQAGSNDMIFDPEPVKTIRVEANAEDVRVEASADGMIHVINELKDGARLNATRNNEVMRVWADGKEEKIEKPNFFKTSEDGVFSFDMKNFGNFMKSLTRTLDSAIRGCSGLVRIQIPVGKVQELQIHSRSGDILIDSVNALEMELASTSGDVRVESDGTFKSRKVNLSSTSGDVSAKVYAENLNASSMSGDVEIQGYADRGNVRDTSGDIEINGAFDELHASSVSGDVELCINGTAKAVHVSSTSGDVSVVLPVELPACVTVSTVSGDVNNMRENNADAETSVSISTVSGDISVH